MFKHYAELLSQEIMLFNTLIALEQKKRRYILSAQGKELRKLTEKSEFYLKELSDLELKRQELVNSFKTESSIVLESINPTLSDLISLEQQSGGVEGSRLTQVAEKYRNTALNLKKESDENQRLLQSSSNSIGTVLSDLKSLLGGNELYSPDNQRSGSRGASGSLLLNANA